MVCATKVNFQYYLKMLLLFYVEIYMYLKNESEKSNDASVGMSMSISGWNKWAPLYRFCVSDSRVIHIYARVI